MHANFVMLCFLFLSSYQNQGQVFGEESSFFDNVIIDNFEYNVESPENDKNETEALPMETYQEQAETTKPTSKWCNSHYDCPDDQTCSSSFCEDPCSYMRCGDKAACTTINHFMTCQCLPGFVKIDSLNVTSDCQQCNVHSDCVSREMCILGQCEDACRYNLCGNNSSCEIMNNHMSCRCLPGFVRSDPHNVTLACQQCYEHEHCPSDRMCISSECVDTCQLNVCGQNSTCRIRKNHLLCECLPGYSRLNPALLTSPCEYDGSTTQERKSFYLISTPMNFDQANRFCIDRGDKLARLLTKQDNEQVIAMIRSQLPASADTVWLGASCPGNGQPCHWLNPKTKINLTWFHTGEPNSNSKACLHMWRNNDLWKFDDFEHCGRLSPFVCETTQM